MKTLLAHADGTTRCATRLRIAAELARRHQLHFTALFATASPLLELGWGYAGEAVPLDVLHQLHVGWRTRALEAFRASVGEGQGNWAELSTEWAVPGFIERALLADLVVLGQPDPDDLEHQLPQDFAASVLVGSGRPALVVPYAGSFKAGLGERVLVAWKPTPESARALSAALPLLRAASRVDIVEWGPAVPDSLEPGDALGIETYCRLHGVAPRLHRYADEPSDVGEAVLTCAADLDADLLVMGCYGHSRAREFVLGGASRTVLRAMTLPVLMSH